MHVIVCARVLTRRPAAQPGARSAQARARALPHLKPCGGPEDVDRRAVAIVLFTGAQHDRGEALARSLPTRAAAWLPPRHLRAALSPIGNYRRGATSGSQT